MNELFAGMYFFFGNIPRSVTITLQSRTFAVIAEILQWPYGYWPSWYLLKLCDGLTGPRNVLRIFFFFRMQIEVAIKLLSGIKMFLISMVALKKLIPRKF